MKYLVVCCMALRFISGAAIIVPMSASAEIRNNAAATVTSDSSFESPYVSESSQLILDDDPDSPNISLTKLKQLVGLIKEAEDEGAVRKIESILNSEKGKNLNVPCNFAQGVRSGLSPLQIAASCGNDDIVELLLSHGASPDYAAFGTDAPIFCMFNYSNYVNPRIVGLLADANADFGLTNRFGHTPLMVLCGKFSMDIIEGLWTDKLLANLDCIDADGRTFLHHLTLGKDPFYKLDFISEKCKMAGIDLSSTNLLNYPGHAAIPTFPTLENLTPMEYAICFQKYEMIGALIHFKAKAVSRVPLKKRSIRIGRISRPVFCENGIIHF